MSWREYFDTRTISPGEAVALLQKGDRISYGHATGEPQIMSEAMVENQEKLEDVVVIHGLAMGPSLYCQEDVNPKWLRHETVFAGSKTRKAVHEGRATFVPMHFSDCPEAYRNGVVPITVAVIHVSVPDAHGYCSLGISVDYERAAVDAARLVIAEVNAQMPRTYGDSLIHVSEIDYFIKSDRKLHVMPKPGIGAVEEAIGKNIAGLVDDGACLQLGMGAIPNAIMGFLTDKNDLGIHTELISDGAMELIQSGNITNKYKAIHKNKAVATFASGTTELYEWLNENPGVEFYPVDYINNSHVISLNDNVFSVNSAIQVDLMGQVCAETIRGKQFSGIGGQMDFVRGAAWSKGGKSIIAMPATAKNGTISKIVPHFLPGDAITTPRNDVDYVVTEYGVAHLRGQHIAERAKRLIAIADPQFRDGLIEDFERVYGLRF
ncbi:MAG: acetyl-CoA hydrolase/transferase C-terminal domain-containing protein [Bacillota bacterium]|nr:acetyl-CoA hydrolase/transferase C-terminal domain-containing protein [Bacillota bacterium]